MAATFNPATAYTLPQLAQFYDPSGKHVALINMLTKDDIILQHMKWMMSNMVDGHKTGIVTKIPEPMLRRFYQGIKYTKSGSAMVKDTMAQLADRWGIDVSLLELYEGNETQAQVRTAEGQLHVEGLQQSCMKYILYGNTKLKPDEPTGFFPRLYTTKLKTVIDAKGTNDGHMTSMLYVVWGEDACMGIYPKNTKAGIQHKDLGIMDVYDDNGDPYEAVVDQWKWNFGLCCKDHRKFSAVRNIDTAVLEKNYGDSGYVDLIKLGLRAKNAVTTHSNARERGNFYVSETVYEALAEQAADPKRVHLRYGEAENIKNVLMLHGRPVRQLDSILETETQVSA